MKIFNDIRNYIDKDSFKIIIYNDLIDIVNYKEIKDISSSLIKVLSEKEISINGKDLRVIKMYDNELVIQGYIKSINV